MNENIKSLLRPGERIVIARRPAIGGRPAASTDQYRIGLITSKNCAYVRIKIPRAIWDWEDGWVRSIADANNAIIAFLIAKSGAGTPNQEKLFIKKPHRDLPFFEIRVSSESRMRVGRHHKVASSVTENGVTRVEVPETIEIKIEG